MTNTSRTLSPAFLCTTMALFASPALAHDGSHELTYLQAFLHALAYAGDWPAALALVTTAVAAATVWRLARRKTSRTKL